MNRNYLILRPESMRNDKYTIRMLSGNNISGLLAFQEKWINGDCRYYYDVTSKQPLGRILEYRNLKGSELKTFLSSLLFSIRQMERFLLDEGQLCLEADFIYTEPENFRCTLVLVPGRYEDFVGEFRNLSQYLLDHVDQNDKDAVVLAFSVFKACQKMNFGIDDIENCLNSINEEAKENDRPPDQEEKISQTDMKRKNPQMEWKAETPLIEDESISVAHEEAEEKESRGIGSFLLIPIVCIMVLIPVMIVFGKGVAGLYRMKWFVGGMELVLAVIGVNIYIIKNKQKKDIIETNKKDEEKEPFWEEYLYKQEETELEHDGLDEQETYEDEMQTMLLTPQDVFKESHSLVSVKGGEDISVPYFPFIIGKSDSISDFCLNKPGVSRLHVKLEEKDGICQVTDLNSTNGTKVDGRLLNANETCCLMVGSELSIAEEKYIFR